MRSGTTSAWRGLGLGLGVGDWARSCAGVMPCECGFFVQEGTPLQQTCSLTKHNPSQTPQTQKNAGPPRQGRASNPSCCATRTTPPAPAARARPSWRRPSCWRGRSAPCTARGSRTSCRPLVTRARSTLARVGAVPRRVGWGLGRGGAASGLRTRRSVCIDSVAGRDGVGRAQLWGCGVLCVLADRASVRDASAVPAADPARPLPQHPCAGIGRKGVYLYNLPEVQSAYK